MQHFETYLARANEGRKLRTGLRERNSVLLNLAGLAGVAFLYLGPPDIKFWPCVGIFIGWTFLVDAFLKAVHGQADKKRERKNPIQEQFAERIAEFDDFREKRTLDERFHPRVASKLDQCARLHNEVAATLDSAEWKSQNSGPDWARIATQAREAADLAMQSAVMTCLASYRPKGMARKVWEAKVAADPDSPEITSRLEEVESELTALREALGARTTPSGSLIHDVLANMAEIRRAEEEVDGTIEVTG